MNVALAISMLLIGMTPNVHACQLPTIPDLIEQLRPKPVERYRIVERVQIPFETIVAKADVIVAGTVQPVKTYLSADRCYLYTDYVLTISEVFAGTLPPAKRPGPQTIVFRQFGGETVIDGVRVVVQDSHLPPFTTGQNVVLFLSQEGSDGVYDIAEDAFGAFFVSPDGTVLPLMQDAGIRENFRKRSKSAFVEEVRRLKGPEP